MAKIANLARMWTSTTGTGTITLGSAVTGFISFATAGVLDGETITYAIEDGDNREIGGGVYTSSGTTLTRSVLKSTNSGSALNLSGNAQVFITASAEDFNKLNNTTGSFTVGLAAGTNVTADRTLTLTTGDENRTFDISAGNVTVSAYGASLVDDANAAAARSTLGLVIGTDVRERLTTSRTYYVRTDGNDSNDGLANTSGGAFLTLQKAVNTVAGLDIGTNSVTISVANGTYTAGVSLTGPFVGSGTVTITGNTGSPSSCVISTTSASAISLSGGARLTIGGVKVQTTTGGSGLSVTGGSVLAVNGAIEYGACATYHNNLSGGGSSIVFSANVTVSGGALYHWAVTSGAFLSFVVRTMTLSGTPAFSVAFAFSSRLGNIECHLSTFSGSATGPRYAAEGNGVIFTNGGGATYLPGNSSGSTSSGGQYY